MSMSDEQFSFLMDLPKLWNYALSIGFTKITEGEAWRPIEMQRIYVRTGRSKTMHSKHLDRMAWDGNFWKIVPPHIKPVYVNGLPARQALEILKPLGKFWESLDDRNRWGGNFDKDWNRVDPWVDLPHFERQ